jgi:hypothetical protein
LASGANLIATLGLTIACTFCGDRGPAKCETGYWVPGRAGSVQSIGNTATSSALMWWEAAVLNQRDLIHIAGARSGPSCQKVTCWEKPNEISSARR